MLPTTRRKKSSLSEYDDDKTNSTGDCDTLPPTIILNQDLIVDYKYAYFHHDNEDVQQNLASFVVGDKLEPNLMCTGDECQTSD